MSLDSFREQVDVVTGLYIDMLRNEGESCTLLILQSLTSERQILLTQSCAQLMGKAILQSV